MQTIRRKLRTVLYGKCLVRPLTTCLDKLKLLSGIKGMMPVLCPFTNVLFRLPLAGRLFRFAIPVANYVHEPGLTAQQRYEWAILDTLDMLSPQYDEPRTQHEIERALSSAGIKNLRRVATSGVNIVGEKEEK